MRLLCEKSTRTLGNFFGCFVMGSKNGNVAKLDFDQEVYLTTYSCIFTRGKNLAWVIVKRNHNNFVDL